MLSNYQLAFLTQNHTCTQDTVDGIFSLDEVPSNPSKYPAFFICNSQNMGEQGAHWFSMYFPDGKGPTEFYCSLGNRPEIYSNRISHILAINGDGRYKAYTLRSQPEGSLSCGYFCLWFVDQRSRGIPFEECMNKLHKQDLDYNEKLVVDYVTSHM